MDFSLVHATAAVNGWFGPWLQLRHTAYFALRNNVPSYEALYVSTFPAGSWRPGATIPPPVLSPVPTPLGPGTPLLVNMTRWRQHKGRPAGTPSPATRGFSRATVTRRACVRPRLPTCGVGATYSVTQIEGGGRVLQVGPRRGGLRVQTR